MDRVHQRKVGHSPVPDGVHSMMRPCILYTEGGLYQELPEREDIVLSASDCASCLLAASQDASCPRLIRVLDATLSDYIVPA